MLQCVLHLERNLCLRQREREKRNRERERRESRKSIMLVRRSSEQKDFGSVKFSHRSTWTGLTGRRKDSFGCNSQQIIRPFFTLLDLKADLRVFDILSFCTKEDRKVWKKDEEKNGYGRKDLSTRSLYLLLSNPSTFAPFFSLPFSVPQPFLPFLQPFLLFRDGSSIPHSRVLTDTRLNYILLITIFPSVSNFLAGFFPSIKGRWRLRIIFPLLSYIDWVFLSHSLFPFKGNF